MGGSGEALGACRARFPRGQVMASGDASTSKGKVLVVDDSESVLETTQVILEEAGYEVLTLSDPSRFLRVIQHDKPNLAMVDVAMPFLNGNKLVEVALGRQI